MFNYNGKTIYLGIDVHKKTYSITAICDQEVVKRETMDATPKKLMNYFRKFFPGAKIISAYEAGFSGLHLHRTLIRSGIENLVVNPSSIEIAARERVKTDKRDSLKIATQLAAGRLKSINIPSEKQEELRLITRFRERVLRHRKRIGCQLKAMLHQFGVIAFDETQKISEKWIKKLCEKKFSPPIKYCVHEYSKMWLYFNKLLKDLNNELECQAQADARVHEIYERARLVWKYVEKLDLSKILLKIGSTEGSVGRPATDPHILLALWLYATIEGIGQGRVIERYCSEHNAFKWICGGVNVNYHTINEFRVDNEECLNELIMQSVAMLMAQNLINLEEISQDGIKVRAHAGASSFRRKDKLKNFQKIAKAHVEKLNRERLKTHSDIISRKKVIENQKAVDRENRIK